jgi:hypothetical protein
VNIFYVYAYLRNKDSKTAKAGTPYYIGKGKEKRYKEKHVCPVPEDRAYIVLLEQNLTEIGAFALERRLIKWWGRKDNKTGILLNLSDGGEGPSGAIHSAETRAKRSKSLSGRERPLEDCNKISLGHKGKPKKYTVWNKGIKMPLGFQSEETKMKRAKSLSKSITLHGVTYESYKQAGIELNLSKWFIRKMVKEQLD